MCKPIHVHDSEQSVFLGHFKEYGTGRMADLYFQAGGAGGAATVIARFGPDEDYRSGLGGSFGGDEALMEARRRAQVRKLVDYDLAMAVKHLDCKNAVAVQEFVAQALLEIK